MPGLLSGKDWKCLSETCNCNDSTCDRESGPPFGPRTMRVMVSSSGIGRCRIGASCVRDKLNIWRKRRSAGCAAAASGRTLLLKRVFLKLDESRWKVLIASEGKESMLDSFSQSCRRLSCVHLWSLCELLQKYRVLSSQFAEDSGFVPKTAPLRDLQPRAQPRLSSSSQPISVDTDFRRPTGISRMMPLGAPSGLWVIYMSYSLNLDVAK